MKKNILILVCLSILLALPNLAVSDCTDFSRVTSWYVQSENTIIFYKQMAPVARVVLKECTVNSSSNIRPTKSYMCDEDSLVIDGQVCAIMELISASSGSF